MHMRWRIETIPQYWFCLCYWTNRIGFSSGSGVLLNVMHSIWYTIMKQTLQYGRTWALRVSAWMLFSGSLCSLWIILFSPVFCLLFLPDISQVVGVLGGGWLSMSPSDSRGAAFTLSKRGEPSLLISPRTAQSRVVVGLWKPLLSRWVSTLSPPLTLIPPPPLPPQSPSHHPPLPLNLITHSWVKGRWWRKRRRGMEGRGANGWSCGSISNKCSWLAFKCLIFFFFPVGATGPVAPRLWAAMFCERKVCLAETENE